MSQPERNLYFQKKLSKIKEKKKKNWAAGVCHIISNQT